MTVPEFDLATLHEAIAHALAEEPCVITAQRSHSWRETTDRTRRFAAVLRASGLGGRKPVDNAWETGQDHLGIYLHNGAEYLEGLLGAHKASVAPFNVNYRYTSAELAYLLRDAQAKAVLFGGHFAETLAAALGELEQSPLLIQVDDGSGAPLLDGALDYETALAAADPAQGVPSSGPEDRHLLYTGGTTGMPKGVIWRAGDLVAGPLGVRKAASVDEVVERALRIRGRVLPAPPLMHGAGTGPALGGWMSGATIVFPSSPERFDAAALLDTCVQQEVTSTVIVGDAFGAPLVAELEARPRALPALKLILNSGAALRDSLKDRLRELVPGVRISDMLGSSETGLHAKRGSGSSTFAARGNTVLIDETRTRIIEPGSDEVGWLAQGGAIPVGYLGDPDKTSATFVTVDGRRFSIPGDRARLTEAGEFEFLGREATTINTGGEKVFAEEVEHVVRALHGVADAVVVGRPSERWGQEVVALYQPVDDTVTTEQLRDGCRDVLAGYKIPKVFLRVDRVRRHANGKTDYAWAKAAAVSALQERA
ncbi:acyl-CoA synthetase (AMP-forming)/AMP-acid ligase II [Nocardia tenerifensis]|uniref:Acyl-CoA synthetase (AMP-forming)/AMP-acid ligase II n=1 Tax=Nocardia tenerifensis TaxID=228006 RepID=A0A318JRI0_9NOCA|nr:AMP-binding protein [Nocardia tenerifensis]PXX58426.1 acyl-CoA synthetase (AMP-forming)/AMP-acid ligase II [Nocardia tenerifensis]